MLCEQEYGRQGKASRGLLRRYIEKITGMSRAQVTRLIGRYMASGRVGARAYRRHRFAARYTIADIELLASVDEAHETLSGAGNASHSGAGVFGSTASRNMRGWLRSLSSHIYNLRRDRGYRQRRLNYVKTKPTGVTIAERRRPNAQGRPGYLRVDAVHPKGIRTGPKASFTSTPSTEVTQWQIVAATERIS